MEQVVQEPDARVYSDLLRRAELRGMCSFWRRYDCRLFLRRLTREMLARVVW